MSMQVVRRMASDTTHVMDVTETANAVMFGAEYHQPNDGTAACGVGIRDGVVMHQGTAVRCRACRHVTGIAEQGER